MKTHLSLRKLYHGHLEVGQGFAICSLRLWQFLGLAM